MRLTAELVIQARAFYNPLHDRELDLRAYKLPAIENLGATQDQFDTIDLSDNDIQKLGNFPTLRRLRTLLISNNRISRVDPELGKELPNLDTLVLANNRIVSLGEVDALAALPKLHIQTLSLLENPVFRKQHYRLYVIHKIPHLKVLDFRKIRRKERRAASQLFKSEEGKALARVASAETSGNTFVPGEGLSGGPQKLTPAQVEALKRAIAEAKTPAEIDRLERMLEAGVMPASVAAEGASNGSEKPAAAAAASAVDGDEMEMED